MTYDDQVEAYWGTTPEQLDANTIVESGGSAAVDTATRDSVTFNGTARGFDAEIKHGLANTGAFQIVAGTDFTDSDHYVFGMSKVGDTPIAKPVATFQALTNATFEVIPVVKFYVADEEFIPGTVIEVKEHASKAAEIDFTGRPEQTATVVQGDNGAFSVSYS